ncbi:MAG: endo-1,3-alpha-glucanase family glycosylhydrolase [Ardenticatenaceae bacterium]|nr:endo-1,3-alpha-glucanase family glycosylhydrolase [Ardenticatenaceae bacterium]
MLVQLSRRLASDLSIVLLAGLLFASGAVALPALLPRSSAGSPRLVLAFYYAWFDENTWTPAKVPDLPAQPYASRDPAAIRRHVEQAQGAGIDAFVQSWWGFGNPTDENFKKLLDIAAEKGFRATIDFELTSPFYHSRDEVVNSLRSFMQTYGGHPALLRWQGKPVLFFWRQQQYDVATWKAIRDQLDPGHGWIWIAEGVDVSYQQVFDGHHLYSVAWSPDPAGQLRKFGGWMRDAEAKWGDKLWVATVMPGYNDTKTGRSNAFVRDRAQGTYYRACWQGASESGADWAIITSWNEWPEGSYIEPSQAYGDTYLNLTRELAAGFKSGPPPPPPAPAVAAVSLAAAPAAPAPGAAEWALPAGRFYTQTGGGQGGFAVLDDAQARFWSEFRRLGGVQALGYPISRRFERDGFVVQAFQKAILQWRPAEGRVALINVFDELSRAGKDGALAERFQTPHPPGRLGWRPHLRPDRRAPPGAPRCQPSVAAALLQRRRPADLLRAAHLRGHRPGLPFRHPPAARRAAAVEERRPLGQSRRGDRGQRRGPGQATRVAAGGGGGA